MMLWAHISTCPSELLQFAWLPSLLYFPSRVLLPPDLFPTQQLHLRHADTLLSFRALLH